VVTAGRKNNKSQSELRKFCVVLRHELSIYIAFVAELPQFNSSLQYDT